MSDQIDQIVEMFAAPRGNLDLVVRFGSVDIYTSNILKKNFIKAMSKTSRIAPVVGTIEKLIDKHELIPCYLTDKIIKTLLKRQPPEFKGYAGTTFGKYILVYVDNDTNIFGFASNNDLSITTLHELIHKASNKYPKQFLNTFMQDWILFYHFYWCKIFSLDSKKINIRDIKEIITFLYNTTENKSRENKDLVSYHKLITEKFKDATTLNEDLFNKIVQDYIVLIKIVWKGMSSHAPNLIEKAVFANRQLIIPLYSAYKITFGINIRHIKELCYQELYAPSEVISLPALVKLPDKKVYNIVNKL